MPKSPKSPDNVLRNLVGALTVSQAVLTALGAANGSLGAVALNNRGDLIAVGGLILVGVFLLLCGQIDTHEHPSAQVCGSLFLTAAILWTAYLVLSAPIKSSSPVVDAEVLPTRPPLLRGEVKATGIKRGQLFQVRVNGLDRLKGEYYPVKPVLYHGVLGADSSGEIEAKFKIPIHSGKYEAVSVLAWTKTEKRPPLACGFSREGGFDVPHVQSLGCALIFLAAPSTTMPPSVGTPRTPVALMNSVAHCSREALVRGCQNASLGDFEVDGQWVTTLLCTQPGRTGDSQRRGGRDRTGSCRATD